MHGQKCASKKGRIFMCPRLTDTAADMFCCGEDHCCSNRTLSIINNGVDAGQKSSPWFGGIATVYLIFVFLLIGKSLVNRTSDKFITNV